MDGFHEHAAIWHVQHFTMTDTALSVSRGLGAGVGIEYVGFLRHITTTIRFEDLERRPIVLPEGDIHHRDETLVGPGDPWLMLLAGRRLGRWSSAFRAGITVPLGTTEENPFELGRRGVTHQHIQFGTGTWDPIAGAAVARRFGEVTGSVSALGRFAVSTNDHGYRAGRRLQLSTSGDRRLSGPWRAQAGLDYAHETAETWNGRVEEEGNLGRSDLLFSAGIVRELGGRALVFTVRVPLRTRSNGVQVDYPAIVTLGWAQ